MRGFSFKSSFGRKITGVGACWLVLEDVQMGMKDCSIILEIGILQQ